MTLTTTAPHHSVASTHPAPASAGLTTSADLEGSTTPVLSPTQMWLSAVDWLPPLDGPAATTERLLLLVHYGIDWDSWVASYRTTYWERVLPERVVGAAYRSRDLRGWWTVLSRQVHTAPRNAAQRRELELLLSEPSKPVLVCLREKSEALLVRTRLVADAVRSTRTAGSAL